MKILERPAAPGHSTFPVILQLSQFLGKPRRDKSPQPDTWNMCTLPGNVLADPSAPDEQTAFFENVHARSPTASIGEVVLLSTGKLVARFDETNKKPQSFTIPTPRIAGNSPTLNLPSSAEDVYPQISMFGQPKNHISDSQLETFLTLSTFQ